MDVLLLRVVRYVGVESVWLRRVLGFMLSCCTDSMARLRSSFTVAPSGRDLCNSGQLIGSLALAGLLDVTRSVDNAAGR